MRAYDFLAGLRKAPKGDPIFWRSEGEPYRSPALPVLEVVSGIHIIADITLGLGKVVHDIWPERPGCVSDSRCCDVRARSWTMLHKNALPLPFWALSYGQAPCALPLARARGATGTQRRQS